MHRSPLRNRLYRVARSATYLMALVVVVACGDSPVAPKSMDRDAVKRVLPAVIDAQQRIVPRLESASVRQVAALGLQRLRSALIEDNVHQASLSLDRVADAVTGAMARASADDAADFTAIELMLYAVARVVDGARAEIRFKASP